MRSALPSTPDDDVDEGDQWKLYARCMFLGVVLWALLLLLLLLTPPSSPMVMALFPCAHIHGSRALRGGRDAFVPVTSPTNGGQVIGGVPWPPQTRRPGDPATHAEYARQSNALLSTGVIGVRMPVLAWKWSSLLLVL